MNWQKLQQLDRRIIFIFMGFAILIPLIFPANLEMGTQRVTQVLYDKVESINPKEKVLMISSDYTPQTEAENHPMTITLLRHAFSRRLPVLLLTLYLEGAPLLDNALQQVMGEFNANATSSADSIVYGRDVVYLGWQPPPIIPILSMGRSIKGVYPVDFYGADIDSLELLTWVDSYEQVGLVAAISSGTSPLWYVLYAQPKFGVDVAACCTAVSAPDNYPYCRSGQMTGMLAGMKGAAEYEELVEQNFQLGSRRKATEGMASQSVAHIVIMGFVIIGNIAYFMTRRSA
jgi:hypothetical protein